MYTDVDAAFFTSTRNNIRHIFDVDRHIATFPRAFFHAADIGTSNITATSSDGINVFSIDINVGIPANNSALLLGLSDRCSACKA